MSLALPSFATQTITVIRPAWTDDHGTSVPDWNDASEHTITGCSLQPVAAVEQVLNRDAVTTTWQLFAPASADVTATDRVRAPDGAVYEVTGAVRVWDTGVLDHVDAMLSRVEG
jgi:hypothetical protein